MSLYHIGVQNTNGQIKTNSEGQVYQFWFQGYFKDSNPFHQSVGKPGITLPLAVLLSSWLMSVRQQAPTVGSAQSKPRPPPCVFVCACVPFLCMQIAGCIIRGSLPVISGLCSRYEQKKKSVYRNFYFVLFTYVLIH